MATKTLDPPHKAPRKPKPAPVPRPPASEATTPLLRQYLQIKEEHPGEVLFFRMGDFYEMFFEDAEVVSRTLGIALTARANKGESYAMAGFPHHALDRYLPRMIAAGHRVAICEQVEDPALVTGKRVVERKVVEVVTPGTLTDARLLDEGDANFLLAVHAPRRGKGPCGLAWFEASSGRFLVSEVAFEALDGELERIGPAEVVVAERVADGPRKAEAPDPFEAELLATLRRRAPVAPVPDWVFRRKGAQEALRERFGVATLAGLGLDEAAPYVPAAHAALHYVAEMKPGFVERLDRFARGVELYRPAEHLALDPATSRCLEITRPLRDSGAGGRRHGQPGTLLGAVDRTATAMGRRLLKEWLLAPLRDVAAIGRRQAAVGALLAAPAEHEALVSALRATYDLERLAGRVASGRAGPRDLAALRDSLACLPAIRAAAGAAAADQAPLLAEIAAGLEPLAPLQAELQAALHERPAASPREGEVLAPGHSAELDRLRGVSSGVAETLEAFQRRECKATGIPSLKLGYNKVFGYYLEVTQAHRKKVPPHYVRKQTLKNAERFLTPELKELEAEILTARDRAEQLEARLLDELRERVSSGAGAVLASAVAAATLDVLSSFARLARERGYVRPSLNDGLALRIEAGRHPVLDLSEGHEGLVPNDAELGGEAGTLHLITGPNMAGKSTYIRQVALLTLLAQTGAFVPAQAAEVGVVDRIFARVGAGDELAQGLSTFMVEMTETANILRHATDRSLVILDEVGRGTSTYDGVSLAWAIAEHLHDRVGARTLFATHYHELTGLSALKPGVRNRNVAVAERGGEITFLHQIVPGSADRSYGIHVARLAGLPRPVLVRAQAILADLEQGTFDPAAARSAPREVSQLSLFEAGVKNDPIRQRLRDLDVDATTPLDALVLLAELRRLA